MWPTVGFISALLFAPPHTWSLSHDVASEIPLPTLTTRNHTPYLRAQTHPGELSALPEFTPTAPCLNAGLSVLLVMWPLRHPRACPCAPGGAVSGEENPPLPVSVYVYVCVTCPLFG